MRRPSFQFYVGDWQSNSNLRRCTFTEKGIWLDVMCLMHDGEQYGVLRWTLKEIAQAVGCKLSELKALVSKGVLKGADESATCLEYVYTPRSGGKDGPPVTLIPQQPGPIWYSSRMVKDEHVSKNRGKGTRFGEHKPPPKPEGEPPPTRRVGDAMGSDPSQRIEDGPSIFDLPSSASGSKKDVVVDARAHVENIFDWLETFFNSGCPLFSSPVSAWLSWGADFDLDIKPAAQRWKKANPQKAIRSLEWLDESIAASIQKRLKPMPEVSATAHSPPMSFAEMERRKNEEVIENVRKKYAESTGV